MTKLEIYKAEQNNTGTVILYLEGKFYKAYERSAWLLCTLVHEFKVSCGYVKTVSDYLASIGFPFESLEKWSGGKPVVNLPDGCKSISFSAEEVASAGDFQQWKEGNIKPVSNTTRREETASGGDPGLRLYGLSYRLALELARDSALLNKTFRYSLEEQVRLTAMRLSLDVESAGIVAAEYKFPYLERARESLRELQLCLRMLADLKALSDKRYAAYIDMTADISKKLHNWEKSQRRPKNNVGVCAEPQWNYEGTRAECNLDSI